MKNYRHYVSARPNRQALEFRKSTAPALAIGATVVASLIAATLVNRRMAKNAERDNPPTGKFVSVDGVRLHYIDRGEGTPLVMLHGNGSMVQDFESSGLIDLAVRKYRVIAFDRPGFGHSERPRTVIWTAKAQAELIHKALAQIGIERPIVLGHSWGASVALALAQEYPQTVSGLVLASGYYYPTVRLDVVAMAGPAIPLVGDIVRHAISPILGRLMWPAALRMIFGPAPVPAKFARFPKEMALRPSQLRAAAAEAALMIPGAVSQSGGYEKISLPVVIVAGQRDRLIDIDEQSARLHGDITQSLFRRVSDAGHMVHQTSPEAVMSAIDEAADAGKRGADPSFAPRPAPRAA